MKKLPICIGFIMDGNRRFAKAQGLPSFEGHRKGSEVFLSSVRFVRDAGIAHAVYYAFSTENWKREKTEVRYLLDLFTELIVQLKDSIVDNQTEKPVRVRFIGQRSNFKDELLTAMAELEEESAKTEYQTTIWIALSYGGRAEIVEAVNQAVGAGRAVTEETFSELLSTSQLPEPDLIVRTGGEQRLSNFLTWKSVYSELYFIDTLWPALTETDFKDILITYEKRQRRYGI